MRGKSAVVTFDHDPSAGTERLRPPGEDAPVWLAPLLAVAGVVALIWVAGEALEPRVSTVDLPLPIARPEPIATNEGASGAAPATAPTPVTNGSAPAAIPVAPNGEPAAASHDARIAPTVPATLPVVPPPTIASPPLAPASTADGGSAGAAPITRSDEPNARPSAGSSPATGTPPVATGDATTPVPTRVLTATPPPPADAVPSAAAPIAAPATTPIPIPASEPTVVAPPAAPAIVQPSAAAPTSSERAAQEPSAPAPCLPMVTIPFGHDSTRPIVEGREAAVRPLLDWLATHPGASISVEGHADTVGTEDYNIVLSFGRARAVASWLGRLGVAPSRIATRAAGTTPAKGPSTDVSTNRLVVLQIEGVDVCRVSGDAAKRP